MMHIPLSRTQRRTGVTLLELILALGLSTVLLAIISMALSMYWRMFDQRRTELEEARIARSVLRKVSDDLRNTIQFQPPDLSGLNIVSASMQGQLGNAAASLGALTGGGDASSLANLAAGATGADGNQNQGNANSPGQATQSAASGGGQGASGANQGGGGQNQSGAPGQSGAMGGATGGAGSADPSDPMQAGDPAAMEGSQSGTKLGLRGTMYELQIDISRLPRIDEYTSLTDPNNPLDVVDIPSDVKTVSYFVVFDEQDAATLQVGLKAGEEAAPIRGLYRRERSRALSSLGAPLTPDGIARDNSQLLAEEVTAIEFSYFDGYEWFSDWDSEAMGGLPRAIEIAIEVNMTPPADPTSFDGFALDTTDATTEAEPAVYKLVVSVPSDPVFQLPTDQALAGEGLDESSMGMDPTGMGGQDTSGLQAAGLQAQAGMGLGGAGLGGGAGGPGGRGGRGGGEARGGPGRGGQNGGGDQDGQGQDQGRGGRGRIGRGGAQGMGGQGPGGRGGAGLGGRGGGLGGGGLGGAGFGGGGLGGGGLGGAGVGGRR